MASKLQQLQSKACQASKFVATHGTAYYKQLLEQNKQYIQEPPTVQKCNELSKQLFYTRLASNTGEKSRSQVDIRITPFDGIFAVSLVDLSHSGRSLIMSRICGRTGQELKVEDAVLLLCLDWSALHGFALVTASGRSFRDWMYAFIIICMIELRPHFRCTFLLFHENFEAEKSVVINLAVVS
ncbi:uncharacterized protein LOC111300861 [Durio zibethinus]|uniref:Uncharacterized protein LOC111300861 n=1 Tax=Durio zibethinus TaxID=66656 RepID=A0A6P5ZH50_DURZI|nr:uncharacterized protein LOC111300861 [Durio zibethinus]